MNAENLPKPENEQYDPNLEGQDEEVTSGGNKKLVYILVAVVLALVLGYVALPKGQGGALAAATPSFMLDDASVTAKAPNSADSIAAGLKAVPVAKEETNSKAAKLPSVAITTTAAPKTVATIPVAPAPVVATVVPAPAAPEPVPVAAPVVAPAAPAVVSVSGKIEDENGRPLVGATVLLKGSSKGTSTDANGNYTMEMPGGSENTLVYGYGGYEDEVVRSRGTQPVNVILTPTAKVGRRRR